jgi:type I restriction enzyme S subunit
VFEKGGEGWECKKLKDITLKIGSGATPKGGQENYKTSGISLIRSMNVYDLQFKPEKLAFIDDEQAKSLSNVTLKEDDVLLNITGASIARCCVVPNNYLPARVNQHVSIIRPNGSFINSIFLNLLLAARFYKNQLLFTGEQGSTRQALTKVQLETFEIRFPNPKEQLKIIAEISSINDETNLLQTNYQQKLRDLEELKKSILNKAFAGEL